MKMQIELRKLHMRFVTHHPPAMTLVWSVLDSKEVPFPHVKPLHYVNTVSMLTTTKNLLAKLNQSEFQVAFMTMNNRQRAFKINVGKKKTISGKFSKIIRDVKYKMLHIKQYSEDVFFA